jgi:esterase/lipase superfamily enzyme
MHPTYRRLCFAIALVFFTAGGSPRSSVVAQSAMDIRLSIPSNNLARSAPIPLTPEDEIQVRLESTGGGDDTIVSVFVHDENGSLVGRDDPDVATDVFSWSTSIRGNYYVLIRNSGDEPATVRITRAKSGATPRGGTAGRAIVRVFYATDRQRVREAPTDFYGSEPASELSYGYSDVSIPRDHRTGELEGPSIFRLEFRQDAENHVVVTSLRPEPQSTFQTRVSDRVATSVRKEAFVFIHGFNVTFEDAVRRTAQISYDLTFDGPALLFSWPSQAGIEPLDYRKDQRNADLSMDSLTRFLEDLWQSTPGVTIHVVAHSMGNRVLIGALEQIQRRKPTTPSPPLSQIAMLAPDVDAELFRRAVSKIAGTARRLTLYASSADAALKLSQQHGGYKRAGQAGRDLIVVNGIDTIDATTVETSALGLFHSYYADSSTLLADLFNLFRNRPPDERFGLRGVRKQNAKYWEFRPTAR